MHVDTVINNFQILFKNTPELIHSLSLSPATSPWGGTQSVIPPLATGIFLTLRRGLLDKVRPPVQHRAFTWGSKVGSVRWGGAWKWEKEFPFSLSQVMPGFSRRAETTHGDLAVRAGA